MLKHLTRIEVKGGYLGQTIHRLIDPNGNYIEAYDRFSKHLVFQQYPWTTRKRYSEASARFLDYLFEVKVLGAQTENHKLNQAVAAYPILLRDGPNFLETDVTNISGTENEANSLSEYAKAVGMKHGLSSKSFGPTIAAINLFLTFAQNLAKEDVFQAAHSGFPVANDELRIEAIDGFTQLSLLERIRLKQNSMLAAVKRRCGDLKRPKGVKSPARHPQQIDHERLDFPLTQFPKLISVATNYRDKALWTLLGASGIRESEALNLQLEHIDPVARRVYVRDPDQLRFGAQMTRDEKQRFKGRVLSRTYLFEPLRSEFFSYFELYLRYEFIPTSSHEYVFQVLQGIDHGKPLYRASDSARIESFKRAVRRAGIRGADFAPEYVWTPHSLRHMYGVYMLNYIPVPGGFGLRDSEVQMLMGHKDISSTRHYARQDDTLLRVKLEAADRLVYEQDFDISSFPLLIANRLYAEAENFKRLARRNND